MRFVETPVFTTSVRALLDDDEYRAMQSALLLRPEQGAIIPGSGGIRKLRWTGNGRGKRGGIRVIYFWIVDESVIYMLYAYAKNLASDLTPSQIRMVRKLVEEEFQ